MSDSWISSCFSLFSFMPKTAEHVYSFQRFFQHHDLRSSRSQLKRERLSPVFYLLSYYNIEPDSSIFSYRLLKALSYFKAPFYFSAALLPYEAPLDNWYRRTAYNPACRPLHCIVPADLSGSRLWKIPVNDYLLIENRLIAHFAVSFLSVRIFLWPSPILPLPAPGAASPLFPSGP